MSWPIRHLPVIQNWDCHGCGECCREYQVHVTDAERERIEGQGWEADPLYADMSLFVKGGTWRRPVYRLATRTDNTCIFLNEDGRCRIHAKFGSEAKPLACRIYPYVLVPAGDHWRVGIRFACPSAADNLGRPLSANSADIQSYARALETREGVGERANTPPPLQTGQRVAWVELERFVRAILAILDRTDSPLEFRLRMLLGLEHLCRAARFDSVAGPRLSEFLGLVSQSLAVDTVSDSEKLGPPGWVGRMVFRQTAALYSRRDTGPRRGISAKGRFALFGAAWRFARGKGAVPRVHGLMPHVTFADMEKPAGPLPASSDAMLTRYYKVKVESMHFFGPTNFNLPFWDGLESLLFTFPATMWLSRAFTDRPREEAITLALRIVDDNFAYNRLLGLTRQRLATRIVTKRGDLAKLISWYSQ